MQYPTRMLVSALVALSSLPVFAQENANTGKLLYGRHRQQLVAEQRG